VGRFHLNRQNKSFSTAAAVGSSDQVVWGPLPGGPAVLFSGMSGGVTALDDTGMNFLATPWIWSVSCPPENPTRARLWVGGASGRVGWRTDGALVVVWRLVWRLVGVWLWLWRLVRVSRLV
jgi:hypothetical protein